MFVFFRVYKNLEPKNVKFQRSSSMKRHRTKFDESNSTLSQIYNSRSEIYKNVYPKKRPRTSRMHHFSCIKRHQTKQKTRTIERFPTRWVQFYTTLSPCFRKVESNREAASQREKKHNSETRFLTFTIVDRTDKWRLSPVS